MADGLRHFLEANYTRMLEMLERLVNIDSGSYCKQGIDRCGEILAEELAKLEFATQVVAEPERGNHVRALRAGHGAKPLMLSAHLDTVWPAGTAGARPFRAEGDWLMGPGVGDMKGGLVQLVFALKALHFAGAPTPPLRVFLTGDEELGSVRARPHIEGLARECAWVLVLESSVPPTTVVVRRWGVGAFELKIQGKAAHVLDAAAGGVNACSELARKILALESLTDEGRGIRVSVNLVHGGTARQVTAAEARAGIDVRVRDPQAMDGAQQMVRDTARRAALPGIGLELSGGMTRPPMQPTPRTEALLRTVTEVGRDIGVPIVPGQKAGGSDGSFTAALGVATLDGLGFLGYDLCSERERISASSLVPRTLLLAETIHRLSG